MVMASKLNEKEKQEIGIRIREVRERKQLTQAQAAKGAKLSEGYYARIERGEEQASLATIRDIVKALNIKSSEILPF